MTKNETKNKNKNVIKGIAPIQSSKDLQIKNTKRALNISSDNNQSNFPINAKEMSDTSNDKKSVELKKSKKLTEKNRRDGCIPTITTNTNLDLFNFILCNREFYRNIASKINGIKKGKLEHEYKLAFTEQVKNIIETLQWDENFLIDLPPTLYKNSMIKDKKIIVDQIIAEILKTINLVGLLNKNIHRSYDPSSFYRKNNTYENTWAVVNETLRVSAVLETNLYSKKWHGRKLIKVITNYINYFKGQSASKALISMVEKNDLLASVAKLINVPAIAFKPHSPRYKGVPEIFLTKSLVKPNTKDLLKVLEDKQSLERVLKTQSSERLKIFIDRQIKKNPAIKVSVKSLKKRDEKSAKKVINNIPVKVVKKQTNIIRTTKEIKSFTLEKRLKAEQEVVRLANEEKLKAEQEVVRLANEKRLKAEREKIKFLTALQALQAKNLKQRNIQLLQEINERWRKLDELKAKKIKISPIRDAKLKMLLDKLINSLIRNKSVTIVSKKFQEFKELYIVNKKDLKMEISKTVKNPILCLKNPYYLNLNLYKNVRAPKYPVSKKSIKKGGLNRKTRLQTSQNQFNKKKISKLKLKASGTPFKKFVMLSKAIVRYRFRYRLKMRLFFQYIQKEKKIKPDKKISLKQAFIQFNRLYPKLSKKKTLLIETKKSNRSLMKKTNFRPLKSNANYKKNNHRIFKRGLNEHLGLTFIKHGQVKIRRNEKVKQNTKGSNLDLNEKKRLVVLKRKQIEDKWNKNQKFKKNLNRAPDKKNNLATGKREQVKVSQNEKVKQNINDLNLDFNERNSLVALQRYQMRLKREERLKQKTKGVEKDSNKISDLSFNEKKSLAAVKRKQNENKGNKNPNYKLNFDLNYNKKKGSHLNSKHNKKNELNFAPVTSNYKGANFDPNYQKNKQNFYRNNKGFRGVYKPNYRGNFNKNPRKKFLSEYQIELNKKLKKEFAKKMKYLCFNSKAKTGIFLYPPLYKNITYPCKLNLQLVNEFYKKN